MIQQFSAVLALLVLSAASVLQGAEDAGAPEQFLEAHCIRCHGSEKQKGKLALHEVSFDFANPETADLWLRILEQLSAGDMPPPDENDLPSAIERNAVIEWIDEGLLTTGSGEAWRKKLLAPEYGNWVNHERLFSGEIDTPPYSPARLWRFSPEIFSTKGFGPTKSPFTYATSERGIRDYAATSSADQSTVQMMIIVADSFLASREKRGEFKSFASDQPTPDEETLRQVVEGEFRRVIGRDPTEKEHQRYLAFLRKNMATGGGLDGLKTTIKAMFLSPESIYRMEFGLGNADEHGRRHLSPDELAYAIAYALTDQPPDRNRIIRDALLSGNLSTEADVARLVGQMLDEQLTSGSWNRRDLPRLMRFFEEFFGFHRAGSVFKDNFRRQQEKIPQWNTDMLVEDARRLIEHVLKEDQDIIAELLTTNRFFVAHPGDNEHARERYEERLAEVLDPGFAESEVERRRRGVDNELKEGLINKEEAKRRLDRFRKEAQRRVERYSSALEKDMAPFPGYPFSRKSRGIGDLLYIEPYNLPSSGSVEEQQWNWPLNQPLEMPKEQRAGVLTHPAWLAAHSLNNGNDPIRRGIWVYEKLLAGVLGDLPPDVDAVVADDPHKTLRERMEPLRAERCWKCHRKMNPLGEPFEIFDDWGRHRAQLYFDKNGTIYHRRDRDFDRDLRAGKLSARAIDASGTIVGSGDPKVDGEVKDAVEMMHRLGSSDRARQSFIRHMFRYFMGRNEMLSDSRTLIEAENDYLKSGGSFKALVVSLLSSDSFLYRR